MNTASPPQSDRFRVASNLNGARRWTCITQASLRSGP
jgi:hypothetical protein